MIGKDRDHHREKATTGVLETREESVRNPWKETWRLVRQWERRQGTRQGRGGWGEGEEMEGPRVAS